MNENEYYRHPQSEDRDKKFSFEDIKWAVFIDLCESHNTTL